MSLSFKKALTINTALFYCLFLLLLSLSGLLTSCTPNSSSKNNIKPSAANQPSTLHIAAAANLSAVLPKIIESYKQNANLPANYPIEITYASSGKLYAQINSGAPYDLFLSANQSYPAKLANSVLLPNESLPPKPFTYARGQLSLYSPAQPLGSAKSLNTNTFKQLIKANPNTKITIANPSLAPYGASAKAFLEDKHLYKNLIANKRLVQTENIGQAFQYVHAGSVDYGLVAQSQLLTAGVDESQYRTLEINDYPAILQDGIVLQDHATAIDFAKFIQSEVAQKHFLQAGYLPIRLP